MSVLAPARGLTAAELVDRLARDPEVSWWIRLARQRRKGEELRLLRPFVAAGLVDDHDGNYLLSDQGELAVEEMLGGAR